MEDCEIAEVKEYNSMRYGKECICYACFMRNNIFLIQQGRSEQNSVD